MFKNFCSQIYKSLSNLKSSLTQLRAKPEKIWLNTACAVKIIRPKLNWPVKILSRMLSTFHLSIKKLEAHSNVHL